MHTKTNLVNIEKKHGCTIGVYAYDFTEQLPFFSYKENLDRVAASSIKLFFAGAVLGALQEKNLSLESMLEIKPSDFVQGISILAELTLKEMSVRNLLYLLLAHSDTTAQNVLEQIVPEKMVNEYIQKSGFNKTSFVSKKTSTETHLSRTTPSDTVMFMQSIWKKKVGVPSESDLLLSFLAQSRITYFSQRHLSTSLTTSNPLITERYSKAGKVHHSINDTVVLKTSKGALGLSIFVDNYVVQSGFNTVDHEGVLLVASIAKNIFDSWYRAKSLKGGTL